MIPVTFKDKLFHYEVQPPDVAWEAISADLAQSKDLEPLSKKFHDFELSPPLHAWHEIKSSLSSKEEIPQKSSRQVKIRFVYKIMAAAAILAFIITGGVYISPVNIFKNKLSVIRSLVPPGKKTKPREPATEAPPILDKTETNEIPVATDEVTSKARKSYRESNKSLQNTKVKNPLFVGNELGIIIAAKPIRNAKGEIIQDTEMMNNMGKKYISITGPNGQQTKISSKFLHMLLFINDDNDIDQVDGYFDKTFLESLIWKTRFQDWRNKIINTSLVPSSTNFMDILEFKDLISQ